VVGRSVQDGVLVLNFTEDPVITAANVSPVPLFGTPVATADGFEVDITNYDSTYGWDTPIVSTGSVSIVSTIGSIRKLKVIGLTPGQSAVVTQRNFLNSTYQTATVSAAATATAPNTSGGGVTVSPIPLSDKPVSLANQKFTITGFKPGSSVLTPTMKKRLTTFAKSATTVSRLACVGYTMGPKVLEVDQSLAKRRSNSVCKFLAGLNPNFTVLSLKAVTTKQNDSKYRRTLVILSATSSS
jgi:outer membrane protein OmpA-like peptidoglycan-associated protein